LGGNVGGNGLKDGWEEGHEVFKRPGNIVVRISTRKRPGFLNG
jgi:hypothetical protein